MPMPNIIDTKAAIVFHSPARSSGPPCIQSRDHISTNATHERIPADNASNVPMAMMVDLSLPLNWLSTPIPMA